jgi:uncharacterized membrane protein
VTVDDLDPDEYFAQADRRARERQGRKAAARRRDGDADRLSQTRAGRWLIGLVATSAVCTAVGLVALWPGPVHHHGPSQSLGGAAKTVTVRRATIVPCAGGSGIRCRQIVVEVAGQLNTITIGPVGTEPKVAVGDSVRVSKIKVQPGVTLPPGFERYQFVDESRQGSLLFAGLILFGLAIVLLRWRGLAALAGAAISVALLLTFVVPALLNGEPALLVALVGAMSVMFVTLLLTNGVSAQMLAAALGITATLILVSVLAIVFTSVTHLDGHSTDAALILSNANASLSLRGVVIAGMVIGALGVLADTAVTQASAVMALRRVDPGLGPAGLFGHAFVVGRDHLSATIHTLVLAYAGASLPLLLALRANQLSLADAVNSQQIAEPVIATLVGCIGLIAAVPLTTGLASLLVARIPAAAVPDGHAHHH